MAKCQALMDNGQWISFNVDSIEQFFKALKDILGSESKHPMIACNEFMMRADKITAVCDASKSDL